MLESRLRQELIAVQVRCDRLAREVIRIGTYTYKTTTQSLPSPPHSAGAAQRSLRGDQALCRREVY